MIAVDSDDIFVSISRGAGFVPFSFRWKLHVFVDHTYPKRSYNNSHGEGEISSWDLRDDSGSINLVAFNANSIMFSQLIHNEHVIFIPR